jgi:hypothetical protein
MRGVAHQGCTNSSFLLPYIFHTSRVPTENLNIGIYKIKIPASYVDEKYDPSLKLYEKRMLRRIFESEKVKIRGGLRKLYIEDLHNLDSS